jgi:hypothetical protein
MEKLNLLKQQKILLCLFEISNGEKKNLKFEDIVVALFKKFPKDFHLKGHKEYPDSGDSIKRPLYTFRDKGLLSARNMIFSLTDKGLDMAEKTKLNVGGKQIKQQENFDRYVEKEIKRVENLNSFKLYLESNFDNILDTDFFDYLGISVRSSRMEFKGRLKFMDDIADLLKKQKNIHYKEIFNFHDFMINKFNKEIDYKLNN